MAVVSSRSRWEMARQEVLESQKGARARSQAALAQCREQGLEIVAPPKIPCINANLQAIAGECSGEKLQWCRAFGLFLCESHHERAHVEAYDVSIPQPQDPYFRPGSQVRAALEDGDLILWCQCGEPYYPSHFTHNREDGVYQQFGCPNGHKMEVVVDWGKLESIAPASERVAAIAS